MSRSSVQFAGTGSAKTTWENDATRGYIVVNLSMLNSYLNDNGFNEFLFMDEDGETIFSVTDARLLNKKVWNHNILQKLEMLWPHWLSRTHNDNGFNEFFIVNQE